MKAVICRAYGPPDLLRVEDVPCPSPGPGEVRVRVAAAAVTAGDCEIRRFDFPPFVWLPLRLAFGLFRPRHRIPGFYFSGTVEAAGEGARRFAEGDEVYGMTGMRMGAFAEYVCVPENGVMALKPPELGHAEATTVPIGGLNALHFLRLARISPGEDVLVIGAGGTFGTYAVQLARDLGAVVTGVDRGDKLELLRSIGASRVIDYRQTDYAQERAAYDVVFDVLRSTPFSKTLRTLRPGGRYLLTNPTLPKLLRGLWVSKTSDRQVVMKLARENVTDLDYLAELIGRGRIRPVMDRQFPLEEIVEAQLFVESGRKIGNVVVTMGAADADPEASPPQS